MAFARLSSVSKASWRRWVAGLVLTLSAGLVAATAGELDAVPTSDAPPTPISFDALAGWRDDDHSAALATFTRTCPQDLALPKTGALGIDAVRLRALCQAARALGETPDRVVARRFFEENFQPYRIGADGSGFLTGYFEPVLRASRHAEGAFTVPFLRRPDDLVKLTDANRPAMLDPTLEMARRTANGLVEHPDRAAIMAGALDGRGLEIAFVADPIDAFFAHIQGSATLLLTDGTVMRIAYAGKSGHPYTAIGRVLVQRGVVDREAMTMKTLRQWLVDHPDEAAELMARNRSYIFFRTADELDPALGPVGAAGVQLTPGRSLAVDRHRHSFGTPIWIDAALPQAPGADPTPFRRLMIAQDTGSAIIGDARGDIFFGSGQNAGAIAGDIRHPGTFILLVPKGVTPGAAVR